MASGKECQLSTDNRYWPGEGLKAGKNSQFLMSININPDWILSKKRAVLHRV
jgi:hypothetical protein